MARLRAEFPRSLVVPLQQDFGADLVKLDTETDHWCLYEVKSSKVARVARKARLSPLEQNLQIALGYQYVVIRLLRHPGHPDTFEELSRGT